MTKPARIQLGVIGRPRGVRGAMLFWPHNPDSGLVTALTEVFIDGTAYEVLAVRPMTKGFELQLKGIDSPEAAKALTNLAVDIDSAALPVLGPGEFYLEELRGLAVIDNEGRARGEIIGFTDTGAQTMLDVKTPEGSIVLVPARPEFILAVELGKHVVVPALDGLFS